MEARLSFFLHPYSAIISNLSIYLSIYLSNYLLQHQQHTKSVLLPTSHTLMLYLCSSCRCWLYTLSCCRIFPHKEQNADACVPQPTVNRVKERKYSKALLEKPWQIPHAENSKQVKVPSLLRCEHLISDKISLKVWLFLCSLLTLQFTFPWVVYCMISIL